MERDIFGSALRIVEQLAQSSEPLGVRELSRAIGMAAGSAHRLLQTLKRERLVVQVGERGLYAIGTRISELAAKLVRVNDLVPVALPLLGQTVDRCGESGSILVAEGFEAVCVASAECDQLLRVVFPLSWRGPLHQGASGRLLLAFQPEETIQAVLQNASQQLGAAAIEQLLRKLKTIRRCGYAASQGERQEGYASVAAAIRGPDQKVMAAIALYGPTSRLTSTELPKYLAYARVCATEISTALIERRAMHANRLGTEVPAGTSAAPRSLRIRVADHVENKGDYLESTV